LDLELSLGASKVTGTPKQRLEKLSRSVTLKPGLSEEEVARVQTQLPGVLPDEIRELLTYSAGFDVASGQLLKSGRVGDTLRVIFTGSGDVGLSILPCNVALLGDGCGAWGAIFFVCHDPPVLAIQAPGVAHFLGQVLDPGGSDSEYTLDYVRNAATTRIWKHDPWLVSVQDARVSQDGVVSKFAEQLPDNYLVADLRPMEVGSGFSWGKAGPRADTRRNGAELIFGVEQKAPGFFARMLSRRSG
jgi:hypothetical protein